VGADKARDFARACLRRVPCYAWPVSTSLAYQPSLLGRGAPAVDAAALARVRRVQLDNSAWVDHLSGWVDGHDALLDELVTTTGWHRQRREMYDRTVDVPRLVASLPDDGPGHPVLARIGEILSARYAAAFTRVSLGYYRDGADSVAWHGDYVARELLADTLVASISLGQPRRFLLRRKTGGSKAGRSIPFSLGWGDLLVMGGACQRTWQHAVPKVAHALPRLAVMFRPEWYRPRA
jgi:alkylated DNA repair dioxygenase AlkB